MKKTLGAQKGCKDVIDLPSKGHLAIDLKVLVTTNLNVGLDVVNGS